MSARVTTDVDEAGRVVARKRSRDSLDADSLRHEAALLDAARHPGVVELVGCHDDGTTVELRTGFVSAHSLETLPAVDVDRAAGLAAALAETVADLHDVGIVHGRIDPSHVVLGPGGRPVLCGFSGGGRIGTTPPPGSTAAPGFSDPAATDDAALTPEIDVYGLGALLRELLADNPHDIEPIPDRRVSMGRLRPRWHGYQRRALLTLADQATDDSPLRRPPARRLAADILNAVPSATIAPAIDPFAGLRPTADDDRSPRRDRRRVGYGAIAAGGVLIVVALTTTRGSASVAVRESRQATTSTQAPTTLPVRRAQQGGTIVVGGRRYRVGETDDQVITGDWNCTGAESLALLRPATGALFVFPEWARAGADVSAAPTTVIPDAATLASRDDNGCSTLIVITVDGAEQEVRL